MAAGQREGPAEGEQQREDKGGKIEKKRIQQI
jgi:hypothetical protein